MTAQEIRPSQFITTYGVGAIIETTEGPQLIPSFRQSRLFQAQGVRGRVPLIDFEIMEPRLSTRLIEGMLGAPIPRGLLIFRLPSNAELQLSEHQIAYRTIPFPRWGHCELHQIIYSPSGVPPTGCPRCTPHPANEVASKARREAVRFVRACKNGHLDEVPWKELVHQGRDNCQGLAYSWVGAGGGLKNVELVCLECGGRENFGKAYLTRWICSGRLAEDLAAAPDRCTALAEITQRLATNLRLADTVSVLTIPPTDGPIHRMLLQSGLYRHTIAVTVSSKDQLLRAAERLVERQLLDPVVLNNLRLKNEGEILHALEDLDEIQQHGSGSTSAEVKAHELRELQKASQFGHMGAPGDASDFEVDNHDVQRVTSPGGLGFRITPVKRLRVVTVQTGYRRLTSDPDNSRPVETSIQAEDGRLGLPGVEVYGEGLFIDLPDSTEPFPRSGPVRSSWESDPRRNDQVLWPEYIWWHTFSHRLINALAVDSGYSATSIRERVYARLSSHPNGPPGGILLFTSQPGSDGSLGGLVAQAPRFSQVVDSAIDSIDECSNDPLCADSRFVHGKANGAACYACELVSETACEARNRGLDRNLLLESPP